MTAVAGRGEDRELDAITEAAWGQDWREAAPAEPIELADERQRRGVPERPVIRYRTALEIAAATSEQPDWLVRGFVALGAITEIDGKVKSSGKTTLVTHLVAAVLDGEPFLGLPTMRTKVVYISEQPPGSFREALARAGLLARGDELRIALRGDVSGLAWPALIATATADAMRDGYGLIVVDTFGKLAGLQDENDAANGTRAMAPLQDAAHAGIAVLVTRHDRKGGGDVGESGRGSSAISGDVDVILQVRRPEGNQPSTRRVIETLSRYSETPEKVVIELTEDGYVLLGDEEAVTLADAIRKVSAHLRGLFEQKESVTMPELVAELGMTRAAIQRALKELEYRGEVERRGEGVKGSPYRFTLTEKDSAHTHGLYGQKESGAAS